jgi:hypothetical protein
MLFIIVTPGTYNNCINGLKEKNIFFIFMLEILPRGKSPPGFVRCSLQSEGSQMKKTVLKQANLFNKFESVKKRKN